MCNKLSLQEAWAGVVHSAVGTQRRKTGLPAAGERTGFGAGLGKTTPAVACVLQEPSTGCRKGWRSFLAAGKVSGRRPGREKQMTNHDKGCGTCRWKAIVNICKRGNGRAGEGLGSSSGGGRGSDWKKEASEAGASARRGWYGPACPGQAL